jgi:hypothetical protein
MLRFLKWVKIGFWGSTFTLIVTILAFVSVIAANSPASWEQITADNNISNEYTVEYRQAISKSRQSAVLVKSSNLSFWSGSSTMTGTYFVAQGRHYVITVYHGIHGPCWLLYVSHGSETQPCSRYVEVNEMHDYALIELAAPLSNRSPIRIPDDLPRGPEWNTAYSILNNIIYTGYPNTVGPLTLKGDVVGYGDDEYLYVFSHAYGGSSGSGVFTREGKYIGYIVAIDVGETELGPDVLENIVIVAPAFNVDWGHVLY